VNNRADKAADAASGVDARRLMHELQVHQIELESQNEELRQARDQAETLLARYTDLYDFAPTGYVTLDRAGTILQINLAGASWLGLGRSDLIGRPWALFLAPQSRPGFTAFLEDTFSGSGRSICALEPLQTADGRRYITIEAGALSGAQECRLSISDCTQRKKAEERLAWLATFPELNPNSVIEVDLAGGIQYINPAARSCFPDLPARGLGHPWLAGLKAILDDFKAGKAAAVRREAEAGGCWYLQSILHVAGTGTARIYGVDISERKRQETELAKLSRVREALHRSGQALIHADDEAQFLTEACRIIVEICGHAMAWIGFAQDDEGKTIRPVAHAGCEDGYLQTLGLTWAETERGLGPGGAAIRTGKPALCRHATSDPKFAPWRAEAMRRGYQSFLVLPLLRDSGAFGELTVCSCLPDAFTQEEVEMLAQLADDVAYGISTLRLREAHAQAQKVLRQAHEELEIRVAQRTKELQETNAELRKQIDEKAELGVKFRHSQKMEAIGMLAGGIAHDFNNVLTTIVGYNYFLTEGLGAGHPLRAFCLDIRRSAEMAASLTHQLLALGRHQVVQPRVIDPNSVLLAMAKMLRRLVGENIEVVLAAHPSVWPVYMDSGQLEQVFLNLAVNARDAMPRGGRLALTTKNVFVRKNQVLGPMAGLPVGRYVCLEVRDTGVGMDKPTQARIFEPFFTTKEIGRGTGLGLCTVKGIVEQYRGSITISSEPGKGSLFRIHFPVAPGGAKAMVPGDSDKSRGEGGDEAVLLVEDNDALRAIIKQVLQEKGYRVSFARSAEEAVAHCDDGKASVDVLLTDVVLPDMDGLQLAKLLEKSRPGLKVIYMSGYVGNALNMLVERPDAILLEKPFSPEKLLKTLRGLLKTATG